MLLDKLLNLIIPKKEYSLNEKYFNEFLIVGTAYNCKLNKKIKRQSVIKKSKLGDLVTFKPFVYKKQIGYAVVSDKLKLDLGVLSQGAADWLASNKDAEYIGILSQKLDDSFIVKVYIKE